MINSKVIIINYTCISNKIQYVLLNKPYLILIIKNEYNFTYGLQQSFQGYNHNGSKWSNENKE